MNVPFAVEVMKKEKESMESVQKTVLDSSMFSITTTVWKEGK